MQRIGQPLPGPGNGTGGNTNDDFSLSRQPLSATYLHAVFGGYAGDLQAWLTDDDITQLPTSAEVFNLHDTSYSLTPFPQPLTLIFALTLILRMKRVPSYSHDPPPPRTRARAAR